ncbi:hypothetical protein EDC94DRAFT_611943 [Helicostylum pulchrum]|nr:hypothetical protein EDC94DRAFT_611943 [Helicostylum pulchrum]
MSLLPYEVLALTLGYLEPGELLGCQLTSKQWYKASLPRLHATKYIVSERIAALYIRAVTNSPHLGKYLDNIILYCLYEKNGERIIPVLQDLLDAVIQYCPNVTKITWMDKEEFPLWTQLMHAASRGELAYLKSLPKCSCTSSGSYIYTALSFKNSLVSLFIRDECLSFGPQLARLGALIMFLINT